MADEKKVPLRKPWSLHLNEEAFDFGTLTSGSFVPADKAEKEGFIPDRPPTSYWKDAWRRFRRNAVAMVALAVLVLIVLFAFVGPMVVPYGYDQFNRGAENLHAFHYSLEDQLFIEEKLTEAAESSMTPEEAVAAARAKAEAEGRKLSIMEEVTIKNQAKQAGGDSEVTEESIIAENGLKTKLFGYSRKELERKAAGEKVFPHVFGTDGFGRDIMVRTMIGARVSLLVGVFAALLVLIIGAVYGSVSGYAGGMVDAVMQRIVEVIQSVPEVLVILLISVVLKERFAESLATSTGVIGTLFHTVGTNVIAMFIAFGSLYWVTMSRIIRGQILQLKQQEYVTAAKALGAKGGRIIKKHLLPNCIGQIVTTTFLQIPSAIFVESFLSYLGVGVDTPMTSLGSMCTDALGGMYSYPERLLFPAVLLSVMILSLNLVGDGLRDALDPKLKK
ncbi:MAG: ABC transporter permease [Oscillospiraceae bacterium]|jgi:oligopeptide transport system permease protein|nr:ABC transporter permease [Oscillospiraceae bacterium]